MSNTKIAADIIRSKNVQILKTLLHLVFNVHFWVISGFGVYIYMNITEKQLEEPLIRMAATYMPCYGTIWNASFQTLFLGLALVHDVLRWLDKHDSKLGKKIKYFRDVIFNGLVFPFTCFVTGMFWCVYLIDRELVFPEVYDQIVPWWLNHCVHTNIFIVISIETLLTRRRQPTDVKVERFLWVFVSVFYAVVYYSIYFFGGCWLYGVFGIMTWWQVCIYQTGIWASTWVFYNLNFFVNRMVHCQDDSIIPKLTKSNGDLESRETTFQTAKKGGAENGLDSRKLGDRDRLGEGVNSKANEAILGDKDVLGESVGKANEAYASENGENNKEWKSIEMNGGENENGSNQAFDKSWSTKYRTNRNQFEKSSL